MQLGSTPKVLPFLQNIYPIKTDDCHFLAWSKISAVGKCPEKSSLNFLREIKLFCMCKFMSNYPQIHASQDLNSTQVDLVM